MYLLDVSIRYLNLFCVFLFYLFYLFMLLASLRCYTSIFDGFIIFYKQGPRLILWAQASLKRESDFDFVN